VWRWKNPVIDRLRGLFALWSGDPRTREFLALRREIGGRPRKTPGRAAIWGWKIRYLDAPALLSSLEIIVLKGWNDFRTGRKAPMILDCGANIGISVLHYKRKYPKAKIIAFEPDPVVLPVLRENLAANHADGVTVVEAAVWTGSRGAHFFVEGADGSRIQRKQDTATTRVKTVDLLTYLDTPIDFLKMDIEGAEMDVVPHIRKKLSSVRQLAIECHINADHMGKFGVLLESLAGSGFRIAVNSMGLWRDLIRRPPKAPNEFDQYFLVAGWRERE
jgi:FkbM family methyltransferase